MEEYIVNLVSYEELQQKVLKAEQILEAIGNQLQLNKPTARCITLARDGEYVLKQNCHYYIHGYGDNNLMVLGAEGDKLDQNVLEGLTGVDDIDAVITSTYVDDVRYWQMFRCWIRDRSIDKVGRYTDWQHNPLQAVKVKNVYDGSQGGSGLAYIYEYGPV